MSIAIAAHQLGKRYGRTWALRDCTIQIPAGRVVALVGPNGAGKTTLLRLAVGLSKPTEGSMEILGRSPIPHTTEKLIHMGFVAQNQPLYRDFTVAETLHLGRQLNPRWDHTFAETRLRQLAIPLTQRVGKLSGGQHAQVALALALAKRPDVLLLDEPIANLDPLARREFLSGLMDGVLAEGMTIVLSSHIIADLERVCDYLIILVASRVLLTGDLDDILATHKRVIGPTDHLEALASLHTIISTQQTGRQSLVIVRSDGPIRDPAWETQPLSLEDIILAYLALGKHAASFPRMPLMEVLS